MRTAAALALTALAASLAIAGPGDYGTAQPYRAAQHRRPGLEYALGEVVFFAFDPNAFDFFSFQAAPLLSPLPTLGIDPDGRELKALPQAIPAPQPAIDRQAVRAAALAEASAAARLSGYDPSYRAPAKQEPQGFPGLRASCASCHTQGSKSSGGFSLFSAGGELVPAAAAAALAEIEAGRMPPPSSGRPAVPAEEVARLKRGVR